MKQIAETLKPGQVIWPPERELRLWMRRHAADRGLPESALHLTVIEVYESSPDRRGAWLIIRARETPEWGGREFKFKARPCTPWPVVL